MAIDPSGASNSVWIVDNGSDTVYEYDRDTGSFIGSFALAAGNTDPQGIADPPPPADEIVEMPNTNATQSLQTVASSTFINAAIPADPMLFGTSNRSTVGSANPSAESIDPCWSRRSTG